VAHSRSTTAWNESSPKSCHRGTFKEMSLQTTGNK